MECARSTILLGSLASCLALFACEQPNTAIGGFTELHRAPISAASDLEVVMGLVERPGESLSPKHSHPGGEFGFVLEGVVTVTTDGNPERTLEPGASFYQPPGEWHIVGTTAAGTKTVVFRVLERGQPAIVPVD
jgi:quercetin dioxygenase-like cupin family protein